MPIFDIVFHSAQTILNNIIRTQPFSIISLDWPQQNFDIPILIHESIQNREILIFIFFRKVLLDLVHPDVLHSLPICFAMSLLINAKKQISKYSPIYIIMITQRTDSTFISNDVFYFSNMLPRFKPVTSDTRQQADSRHNNSSPIHNVCFKVIIFPVFSNR